jgi:hypothetical protein
MNRFDPFRKSTHAAVAGPASRAAVAFTGDLFPLSPKARARASSRLVAATS